MVLYEIYREDGGNGITFVHMLYIKILFTYNTSFIIRRRGDEVIVHFVDIGVIKVCQLHVTGRWISLGTPVSFTIKTDPSRYTWNIVESGVKHHKPKHQPDEFEIFIRMNYALKILWTVTHMNRTVLNFLINKTFLVKSECTNIWSTAIKQ